jgi:SnoaL-like domain
MSAVPDALMQEWVDRLEIQDLIFRYCDSVTRGDYTHTATLFAPDAIWEEQGGMRFESAREFIDYLVEGSTSLELLIQIPHSSVVEFPESGRAKVSTTIREIVRGIGGGQSALGDAGMELNVDRFGIYHDELEKFGSEWKFTRRTFVPFFTAMGSVIGEVSGSRPLLAPG